MIKLELNIALIPNQVLGDKLTNWSQDIARGTKDTRVMLGQEGRRLSDVPHLTLHQVPILAQDLDELCKQLETLTKNEKAYQLTATGLTYNSDERSLEVGYETPERLAVFQNNIIKETNKLRGDMLLERDPAGNEVAGFLNTAGELGENIRNFGYGEIGNLFRPHATLNWFGPDTDFAINTVRSSPNYSQMSGTFDVLILSVLGSHGRCAQQLAYFPLNT